MQSFSHASAKYSRTVSMCFFFCWATSAEIILEEVDRTYSRVAETKKLEGEWLAQGRFRSLRARVGGQQYNSKTEGGSQGFTLRETSHQM